jgi:hypothetical protein
MQARDVEAARMDPYESLYRPEVIDTKIAQNIVSLSRAFTDVNETIAGLESGPF